jgi:hypothetical protein
MKSFKPPPVFLIIFFLAFYLFSVAQPLPAMFVRKESGLQRQAWFSSPKTKPSKLAILRSLAGPIQKTSYSFTKNEFMSLLDMVRKSDASSDAVKAYFAIFDANNTGGVPTDLLADKQMIVLFTPAKLDFDQAENVEFAGALGKTHYLLMPGRGVIPIDTLVSVEWIKYYTNIICASKTGFISTINQTLKENKYDKLPSDTRSIYYTWDNLDEVFTDEVKHQKDAFGIDVTGVNMNISCYPDTGDDNHKKINRVLIQFDLTMKKPGTNIDEVIYLDEELDYESRYEQTVAQFIKKHPGIKKGPHNMFDLDNGQLCPLNCPPPGGATPPLESPRRVPKKPVNKKQH